MRPSSTGSDLISGLASDCSPCHQGADLASSEALQLDPVQLEVSGRPNQAANAQTAEMLPARPNTAATECRKRYVPTAAPANIIATEAAPLVQRGCVPLASIPMVPVRTLGFTSGTCSLRTVAYRIPIARPVRGIVPYRTAKYYPSSAPPAETPAMLAQSSPASIPKAMPVHLRRETSARAAIRPAIEAPRANAARAAPERDTDGPCAPAAANASST